ncbi:hypothetical protein V6N11_040359 [Hibiscus sabdariffa]|uniref:Uncharacterized protein n=1 Tax=Hibiscus sabdariffa TaxID=183260 RepID=A0ABR2RH83_9ROSI
MVHNKLVAFIYSVVGVRRSVDEGSNNSSGWICGVERKNCPICRFSVGEEERFQFHTREAFPQDRYNMWIWFSSFPIAGF